MQFPVTTQRVAQSTLCFRKRRRIEDDQIVLGSRFFSRAQELKDILTPDLEAIARQLNGRVQDAFAGVKSAIGPLPKSMAPDRKLLI